MEGNKTISPANPNHMLWHVVLTLNRLGRTKPDGASAWMSHSESSIKTFSHSCTLTHTTKTTMYTQWHHTETQPKQA